MLTCTALVLLICSAALVLGRALNIADVNPFVGTGGYGYGVGSTPPGAQVPFGLVRLSPDTAESVTGC